MGKKKLLVQFLRSVSHTLSHWSVSEIFIIILILQIRKMRLREDKRILYSCTVSVEVGLRGGSD